MKSYRKADLSLSVNAIVVLILAIVMLGLALGFVKTMFAKTTGQLEALIENEPESPRDADGSTPLVLSRDTIVVTRGSQTVIKFSAYNTAADVTAVADLIAIDTSKGCIAAKSTKDIPLGTPIQISKVLLAGTSVRSSISFKSFNGATDVVCPICTVAAIGGNCADVRVIVK